MKSILETIKESQVNECGFNYGFTACGGGSGVWSAPVLKDRKSPREKDEEKKVLKQEHPDVIKKFEQLYKEYHTLLGKANALYKEMGLLKEEYPALEYFTWKKK